MESYGDCEGTVTLMVEKNDKETKDKRVESTKNGGGDIIKKKALISGLVLLLMGSVLVAAICLESSYISELRMRERGSIQELREELARQRDSTQLLLEKLERVETELSSCSCNKDDGNAGGLHDGMLLGLHRRVKRNANETVIEESDHIRNQHHGIASSHIALLHASPQAMRNAANTSIIRRDSQTFFRPLPDSAPKDPTEAQCGEEYVNHNNDRWCVQPHGNLHRFILLGSAVSKEFPYFVEAPWMKNARTLENFIISGNVGDDRRRLVVKGQGIYIVTSNMHFTHVGNDTLHYGVYSRNKDNRDETLLSSCVYSANPPGHRGAGHQYPCPTWQLVSLKAGDRVYMKITPFVWFKIDKNSLFLALIKLNEYGV